MDQRRKDALKAYRNVRLARFRNYRELTPSRPENTTTRDYQHESQESSVPTPCQVTAKLDN